MDKINYENGKIYKLVNNCDECFYVGSTTQILHRRLGYHKVAAKKRPECSLYFHLNNIGWKNVKIILIEYYPCKNKEELDAREYYYKQKLDPHLTEYDPTTMF